MLLSNDNALDVAIPESLLGVVDMWTSWQIWDKSNLSIEIFHPDLQKPQLCALTEKQIGCNRSLLSGLQRKMA